jgi:hypothetical protein
MRRKPARLGLLVCGLLLAAGLAGASVTVVGSMTHQYETAPGATVEGTVEILNTGDEPRAVRVYQTDYLFNADGRYEYGEPGQQARSNAQWIALSPRQAVIPAGDSLRVRYTIQVPSDGTLRGTYWSLIMVEPVATPQAAPVADPSRVTVGLTEVFRYAVQIATHVGTGARREVRFSQVRLLPAEGKRLLAVDMQNTGERLLAGSLWAELYDSQGRYAGKFEGGRHRMYPGTSARYTLELGDLRDQSYRALIVLDCGGDDVFGLRANLTLGP